MHCYGSNSTGLKTQRRAKEFARQTAEQYYHVMVSQYALRAILSQEDTHNVLRNERADQNEDNSVYFCGKYSLVVTNEILQGMRDGDIIHVKWHSDRQCVRENDKKYCLHKLLVTYNVT